MKSRRVLASTLLAIILATSLGARQVAPAIVTDPASFVDTRIGSSNGGNTFPGAVLPFGMLAWSPEQIGPDTQRPPDGVRPTAAGGYQYNATRMRGFSLTHL